MPHLHASIEDVIDAYKAAKILMVIEKLPHGYQIEIGERGTGRSGEQHQHVAITRALLKRHKILILTRLFPTWISKPLSILRRPSTGSRAR